jgi:hypothetical protein
MKGNAATWRRCGVGNGLDLRCPLRLEEVCQLDFLSHFAHLDVSNTPPDIVPELPRALTPFLWHAGGNPQGDAQATERPPAQKPFLSHPGQSVTIKDPAMGFTEPHRTSSSRFLDARLHGQSE